VFVSRGDRIEGETSGDLESGPAVGERIVDRARGLRLVFMPT
jgi:hypothetical protein